MSFNSSFLNTLENEYLNKEAVDWGALGTAFSKTTGLHNILKALRYQAKGVSGVLGDQARIANNALVAPLAEMANPVHKAYLREVGKKMLLKEPAVPSMFGFNTRANVDRYFDVPVKGRTPRVYKNIPSLAWSAPSTPPATVAGIPYVLSDIVPKNQYTYSVNGWGY